MVFISGIWGWFNIHKSINMIHHTNRKIMIKNFDRCVWQNFFDKNFLTEKAFDKIQHPFMIKSTSIYDNKCIERTCLHIVKAIYGKPTPNIILNGESLKAFPVRSGRRQGCQLLPLLFNTVLEIIARVVRQNKRHQN